MNKGSYLLGMWLHQKLDLSVGRLGSFTFPAGYYVYAGSAHGPGGLSARLARHRRREKRFHWHIDYLLIHARLIASWTLISEQRLECAWARAVAKMPGARIVAHRFGASDCRCQAHLIHFSGPPSTASMTATLQTFVENDSMVKHDLETDRWLQILIDGDDEAREEAAQALSAIGETAVPRLLKLLHHADADARCWAAWTLAKTGLTQAIAPLITTLDDVDSEVRTCAALALGELRAADAAPALIGQLESTSGLLTRCAADALTKIGEKAVPALIKALKHPQNQVRAWATRSLGSIGSEAAVEALCQVYLYDKSYLAQHYAQEALQEMGLLEMIILK